MQIDRGRFLLLAAAIGAGCSAAENSTTVEVATPSDVPETSDPEARPDPVPVQPKRTEAEMVEACRQLQPPSPDCESFDIVPTACAGFARAMAPDSAEAATDCLLTKGKSPDLCSYGGGSSPSDVVNRCFEAGIAMAQPDPSQRDTCQSIAQQCGSAGMGNNDLEARCLQSLGGLKGEYKNHLITCMSEGCSLDYCGFSLAYATSGYGY